MEKKKRRGKEGKLFSRDVILIYIYTIYTHKGWYFFASGRTRSFFRVEFPRCAGSVLSPSRSTRLADAERKVEEKSKAFLAN